MFKLHWHIAGDVVPGKMRRETKCPEPMKPHGDAPQLAVNAGNHCLFFVFRGK